MNIKSHRSAPQLKILAAAVGILGLLASSAWAQSFFFSTGTPDGLIGTASRVQSTGKIQIETADDFVLTENTSIQQATFTGLIPSGAPLSSITRVEIEIYNVFPLDSTNPPSGNVPTRVNSPADSEIDDATSDSADNTLTYTTTLVNGNFTVNNSVVNGINPSPNQFTGGEGAVTGQEVMITVTFTPPINLPAGQYFFRPEVGLTSGDFLWISAPKPIVSPGTPFAADLQSWIRNDSLAPDWLRIGTDITGQGPFNAAFTLSGDLDEDADNVPDDVDQCPGTPSDSVVNAQGCSLDQLVPCAGPASGGTWKNHGQYVKAFNKASKQFVAAHLITRRERGQLVAHAARSNCGKK
jgi:hypothetical protein